MSGAGLVVFDAQFEPAGRRLATASADGVVRLYHAEGLQLISELRSHKRPVLSVAWGTTCGARAPRLASGAADGHVILWREVADNSWQPAYEAYVTGPAGAVAFGQPPEAMAGGAGASAALLLAVAGADDLGVVTLLARRDAAGAGPSPARGAGEAWTQVAAFPAHAGGATAASWAPPASPATLASGPGVARAAVAPCTRRLATGGVDGAVRIWHGDARGGAPSAWSEKHSLEDGRVRGVVRDVAWRPNVGLPCSYIASCTDEGCVAIWVQDVDGQPWRILAQWEVDGDARRLAWSWGGEVLAVSVGDADSLLYQEVEAGHWERVAAL